MSSRYIGISCYARLEFLISSFGYSLDTYIMETDFNTSATRIYDLSK